MVYLGCVFVCLCVCLSGLYQSIKTIEDVVYLFICGVYQESKQF